MLHAWQFQIHQKVIAQIFFSRHSNCDGWQIQSIKLRQGFKAFDRGSCLRSVLLEVDWHVKIQGSYLSRISCTKRAVQREPISCVFFLTYQSMDAGSVTIVKNRAHNPNHSLVYSSSISSNIIWCSRWCDRNNVFEIHNITAEESSS